MNFRPPRKYFSIGDRFGAWEVVDNTVQFINKDKAHPKVLCQCTQCEDEYLVSVYDLRIGRSRACFDCRNYNPQSELLKVKNEEDLRGSFHGDTGTKLHDRWLTIMGKCYNPKVEGYKSHGKVGIIVCVDWQNYKHFKVWALKNGYDENGKKYLKRKNRKTDFSPKNCFWDDNRRFQVYELFGEFQSISDWLKDERCKVSRYVMYQALQDGKSFEQIFNGEDLPLKRQLKKGYGVNDTIPREKIKAWGEEKTYNDWEVDERCKVKVTTLRSRIKSGMNPEKAMVKKVRSHLKIKVWGEPKSFQQWEDDARCIVSKELLRGRIKAGWESERALTTPPLAYNRKVIISVPDITEVIDDDAEKDIIDELFGE